MSALGLALLVLGTAMAVAEVHVVSHGVLGTASTLCLAVGLALLVAGAGAAFAVVLGTGLAVGLVGAAYGTFVLRRLLAVRRAPVRGGRTGVLGHCGRIRVPPAPVGQVMVDGALWRARMWAPDEQVELEPGTPVVVEEVDGLTLTVRPAEEWEVRS
jgi:membrane-bound serine protease (ClpP class)